MILNDLKDEFSKRSTTSSEFSKPIAISVERYQNEYIIGTNLLTNLPVKARLIENISEKQPTVYDLNDPKNKIHTKPGGVILLEGAVEKGGEVFFRWPKVLNHANPNKQEYTLIEEHSGILSTFTKPTPFGFSSTPIETADQLIQSLLDERKNQGKVNLTFVSVKPEDAYLISKPEDARDIITHIFGANIVPGAKSCPLIRASDRTGNALSIFLKPGNAGAENGYAPLSPEVSAEYQLSNNKKLMKLFSLLDKGEIHLEAIRSTHLEYGNDSKMKQKERLLRMKNDTYPFAEQFMRHNFDPENNERTLNQSIIGLMPRINNGNFFITHHEVINPHKTALDRIPTANRFNTSTSAPTLEAVTQKITASQSSPENFQVASNTDEIRQAASKHLHNGHAEKASAINNKASTIQGQSNRSLSTQSNHEYDVVMGNAFTADDFKTLDAAHEQLTSKKPTPTKKKQQFSPDM